MTLHENPNSLQVVLSLRKRHQDAAESALAEALARQQQTQQVLAALRESLLHAKAVPHACAGELLDLVNLQERARLVPQLQQLCIDADRSLEEHTAIVKDKQQTYLKTRREREVVEALIKQRAQMALLKRNRQDTKVSEDLFLGRIVRGAGVDDSTM